MTKKEQLIKVIYDKIMKFGSISSRGNELYSQTAERIENKIFVRKLPVSSIFVRVAGSR